ncbi:MAG: alpha-L-rhamnosidase C-terminal domain-containing protein [Spirochaetia bacterium]
MITKKVPKWIWKRDTKEERNLWLEFKTDISIPNNVTTVTIEITADSRYILFINGDIKGRGPGRYWPKKMQYDTYILSVSAGKTMTVRVLVHYFGCGTYQYIPGAGGLWCKLMLGSSETASDNFLYAVVTDRSWLVRKIKAYNQNTERICRHLGFVEEFNAAAEEDGYEKAVEIDDFTATSFGKPVPRDIPLLNQFPVSCEKLELSRHLIPPTWWGISEKTAYLPQNTAIYISLTFVLSRRTPITIFLYYGTLPLDVTLNGKTICPGKEMILDSGEYIVRSKAVNQGDYRIKTAVNLFIEDYSVNRFSPGLELSCAGSSPPLIQTSKFPAVDFPPDPWLVFTASKNSENPIAKILNKTQMLFDFKEEVSGYLSFELELSNNCVIDFYLFEKLLDTFKPEHTDGLYNILRYKAKPGRQSYVSVIPRAGRYLMITVPDESEVDFLSINMINTLYPTMSKGSFNSTNRMLNSIWELCCKTTALCMEDTFTDCPTYERTYWVGDAGVQGLCAYTAFGDYSLQRHCLILASHSLQRSPYPEGRVPANTVSRIPSWALIWIISIWEYYIYSGDKKLLYRLYPGIERTILSFHKMIRKNLLWTDGWNFIDWADIDAPSGGAITAVNAFFLMAIEAAERIALVINESDNPLKCRIVSEQIRGEVNRLLWDPECKGYIDCIKPDGTLSAKISEQTQILSYLAGISGGDRRILLEDRISSFPGSTTEAGIGTPYFMHYLLTALRKMDKIDRVHTLIQKYWGQMIHTGSPGCFEVFPGYQKDRMTRSYCHGWSASPLYHIQTALLGVEPLEPGFSNISVNPSFNLEKRCRGAVPTPHGTIHIEWENLESSVVIKTTIPSSIKGYIALPVNYVWTESISLKKKRHSDTIQYYFDSGANIIFKGKKGCLNK